MSVKKTKIGKIPKYCISCGKKLMYRSDNGSENNGWNELENNSFDEYTGRRKGTKYSYRVEVFCPEWNDFWHTIPRPQSSPLSMGHTVSHFDNVRMFDLKKYGITPTLYKKEDDIIHGLPRRDYLAFLCKPKKSLFGFLNRK